MQETRRPIRINQMCRPNITHALNIIIVNEIEDYN